MFKLLALLTLTTTALAGKAYVTNECGHSVFVQHLDSSGSAGPFEIAAGGKYHEAISGIPDSDSRLQVSLVSDFSTFSELEYTLHVSDGEERLYYSLGVSGNGSPFTATGYGVVPSHAGSLSTCVWDFCKAGVADCPAVSPTQIDTTKICPSDNNLNFYVCSGKMG